MTSTALSEDEVLFLLGRDCQESSLDLGGEALDFGKRHRLVADELLLPVPIAERECPGHFFGRFFREVLSPSTEKYDRGAKFRNYQQIPSLMEYILVAQDEAVIERFVRQADGSWGLISFVGLEATLAFTTVPAQIGLKEIYAGVSFDAPAA